jgi:hypothetical protein
VEEEKKRIVRDEETEEIGFARGEPGDGHWKETLTLI